MMISFYLQELANSQIFTILVPLTFIDYLSGVLAAIINKEANSKIGYKGILKKVMLYLGITAIGVVQGALPDVPWLFTSFLIFFILNESISILENLDRAGIPLPQKLVAILVNKKDEQKQPTD